MFHISSLTLMCQNDGKVNTIIVQIWMNTTLKISFF